MATTTSDHSHGFTYPDEGNTGWTSTMATFFQALSDDLDSIGTTEITLIDDTNGNEMMAFSATASAVNYLTLANSATGNAPTLSATGDDTNIDITLTPKGSGIVNVGTSLKVVDLLDTNGNEALSLGTTASAVNELTITNAATGNSVTIAPTGDDTNIGLNIDAKAAGEILIRTSAAERVSVDDSGLQLGGSGARVTTILDEDNMASNSATALCTQQSIKAYVDGAASGITEVVQDTTPQLGGQLDVNGNAIGDGTLELLAFTETVSAVNHINIANAATGNDPVISAVGDDANVGLTLTPKGSGDILLNGPSTLGGDLNVSSYTFNDSNGNELFAFTGAGSAVNHINWVNAATGNNPRFEAVGDDATIGLTMRSKALGTIQLRDGGNLEMLICNPVASAVNYWNLTNSATGNPVLLAAAGDDTNVGLELNSKGTGDITLKTSSTERLNVNDSGLQLGAANARVTTILDEDTMSSDSATALATQQSIKAYVDTQVAGAGGGAWEFVSSTTISNDATVDITGLASGYDYLFVFDTLVTASDGETLELRVGTGGTPTWHSSAGDYEDTASGSTEISLTGAQIGNAANETASGEVLVLDPGDSSQYTWIFGKFGYSFNTTGAPFSFLAYGRYKATTAVTAVRFFGASGNLTSGTIRTYRRSLT